MFCIYSKTELFRRILAITLVCLCCLQFCMPAMAEPAQEELDLFNSLRAAYLLGDCTKGEDKGTMQVFRKSKYNGMTCKEIIPLDLKENLPMFVFLSGNGEFLNLEHETFFKYIKNGMAGNDFIFLAPNNNSPYGAHELNLTKCIEEVAEKYHVDKSRIVISGTSAGAGEAVRLINANPGYFACAILISGYLEELDRSTTIPILVSATDGGEWNLASIEMQEEWVKRINEAGGKAFLSILLGANHCETPCFLAIPDVWKFIRGIWA